MSSGVRQPFAKAFALKCAACRVRLKPDTTLMPPGHAA
jgi:hypothetical protein